MPSAGPTPALASGDVASLDCTEGARREEHAPSETNDRDQRPGPTTGTADQGLWPTRLILQEEATPPRISAVSRSSRLGRSP
jgi:hypothetical protein